MGERGLPALQELVTEAREQLRDIETFAMIYDPSRDSDQGFQGTLTIIHCLMDLAAQMEFEMIGGPAEDDDEDG